jgi:hypothetical protein
MKFSSLGLAVVAVALSLVLSLAHTRADNFHWN